MFVHVLLDDLVACNELCACVTSLGASLLSNIVWCDANLRD